MCKGKLLWCWGINGVNKHFIVWSHCKWLYLFRFCYLSWSKVSFILIVLWPYHLTMWVNTWRNNFLVWNSCKTLSLIDNSSLVGVWIKRTFQIRIEIFYRLFFWTCRSLVSIVSLLVLLFCIVDVFFPWFQLEKRDWLLSLFKTVQSLWKAGKYHFSSTLEYWVHSQAD